MFTPSLSHPCPAPLWLGPNTVGDEALRPSQALPLRACCVQTDCRTWGGGGEGALGQSGNEDSYGYLRSGLWYLSLQGPAVTLLFKNGRQQGKCCLEESM